MKLRKTVYHEFATAFKNIDSSISTSDTSENLFLLVFISSFVSFGVYIYIQYFFDAARNETSNKNI